MSKVKAHAWFFWLRCSGFVLLLLGLPLTASAIEWPQEVDAKEGTIVVYQPQPETLKGNTLTGRSAMSLELKNGKDPIFGAFWFTARLDSQGGDSVLVRDLKVTKVSWPDSKDAEEQRFTRIVEDAIPSAGFEISRERLAASLSTAEVEQKSLEQLKHDPPRIIFDEQLAVLLSYDGKPRFKPVENSQYERALNTPMLVARHTRTKTCYLSSGSLWYEAKDPLGPWKVTKSPPADLVAIVPRQEDAGPAPAVAPIILVATEPTELVVSDGKPQWESLSGGEVLFVNNTETPWLRDLPTGNMYILLSGRWYRAKTAAGPWTFVPADGLPSGFANIPPASDIGGLRTSVAGTPEAEDALLEASIPQTAAIKKSDASLVVEYDGKPKFDKISGTSVSYAVNTGAQVLKINKQYYAVDNGVWFTAGSATGPWRVADEVPEQEIAKIPPSSPVYNTTYVQIYESTPQVVYVGYTPGYLWSFPYYGVPVYGTGWYYPPYWGRYYYPRPPTWGFHVGYNPWNGWNFGVSWSNGFFSMGASWGGGYGYYRPGRCCGGWYGGGYRRPPIVINNTGNINIGNTINVGNRTHIGKQFNNNIRVNNANFNNRSNNIYQRPENRARVADRRLAQSNLQQARSAKSRDNNVFAGSNGGVARKVGDQWQTRENGKWQANSELNKKVSPQTRQQVQQRAQQATPEQRQQAAARAQQARLRAQQATPEQRQQAQQRAQQQAQQRAQQASAQQRAQQATAQQRQAAARATQQRQATQRQEYNRAYSARQSGASMERSMQGRGGGGGRFER
jgi:hypothetical protein